jgi:hypothetical protein
MSIDLQWNLDHTAKSVIEVARGVLQAATTDNVQVLSILACERFGNTIAMSPDTCRKIERSVVPTPEPAVLGFLQATIGYAANDSTSQLGQSIAGVQFLGLASALVTTMGVFKSASALQVMLQTSAADKTMVPTGRHVGDLLERIEPRCHKAGFSDEVAGWHLLLNHSGYECFRQLSRSGGTWTFPRTDGIVSLVDAFRQLRRVGNADITKVVVRTTACAPWTAAFTKWCLGLPPCILFDDGTAIIEQAGSEVSIILQKEDDYGQFSVTVYSSVETPSELVQTRSDQRLVGMVRLETYGLLLREHYGFGNGQAAKAASQALPYALRQVLQGLTFSGQGISDQHGLDFTPSTPFQDTNQSISSDEDMLANKKLSPFSDEIVIGRMCSLLFSRSEPSKFRSLDSGVLVADLPLVPLFRGPWEIMRLCRVLLG